MVELRGALEKIRLLGAIMPADQSERPVRFGSALKRWRQLRGKSQEELAGDAGISTRHLSFLELGRSQPSREVALALGLALDLPLREQNALLEAAGFAPAYGETPLDAEAVRQINRVLDWILAGCEPNGAVVLTRSRNILRYNRGWRNQMSAMANLDAIFKDRPLNSLTLLFHPSGLRNVLENWEEVCRVELSRLHAELRADGGEDLETLLSQLLDYPDVSEGWLLPLTNASAQIVSHMRVRTPFGLARIFSTITRIGAPRDVTLEEIRVEAFAPADAESETILAKLGRG